MADKVVTLDEKLVDVIASGKIVCANPAVAMNIEIGFIPSRVEIFNQDQLARGEWNKHMTAAHYIKTVTDGTISEVAAAGISEYAGDATHKPGFTIGTDAVLNTAAQVLWFKAYR